MICSSVYASGSHALTTLATAVPVAEKSLFEYIAAGREIGLLIVLLSLVAVGMIVAQLVRIRAARLCPADQVEELDTMLRGGRTAEAITYCRDEDNDTFLCRVIGAALARCASSPFGFLELKNALEETGRRETASLHRLTDGIGLIASVAPMLGLLGTVVGMVGAFDTITLSEGPARPDELAGSISQALVTTVLGLIVAIPSTAAHTFIKNRTDALVDEIAVTIEQLAAHLEVGAGPAATPPPRSGA